MTAQSFRCCTGAGLECLTQSLAWNHQESTACPGGGRVLCALKVHTVQNETVSLLSLQLPGPVGGMSKSPTMAHQASVADLVTLLSFPSLMLCGSH
jgi:hypothetical protein